MDTCIVSRGSYLIDARDTTACAWQGSSRVTWFVETPPAWCAQKTWLIANTPSPPHTHIYTHTHKHTHTHTGTQHAIHTNRPNERLSEASGENELEGNQPCNQTRGAPVGVAKQQRRLCPNLLVQFIHINTITWISRMRRTMPALHHDALQCVMYMRSHGATWPSCVGGHIFLAFSTYGTRRYHTYTPNCFLKYVYLLTAYVCVRACICICVCVCMCVCARARAREMNV